MSSEQSLKHSQTKRRRGGQPGNQNAKGNRGNPRPRPNKGNKGGGAPQGNQNARKQAKAAIDILVRDYQDKPEAVAWLKEHEAELNSAAITDDNQRDPALYAAFCGLTPEVIAAQGREYDLGL